VLCRHLEEIVRREAGRPRTDGALIVTLTAPDPANGESRLLGSFADNSTYRRFGGDEFHRRPLHRLGDRFRVAEVVRRQGSELAPGTVPLNVSFPRDAVDPRAALDDCSGAL
jgi:hypothetical protein